MNSYQTFNLFLPGQPFTADPVARGVVAYSKDKAPSEGYFAAQKASSELETSLVILNHRSNDTDTPNLIKATGLAIAAFQRLQKVFSHLTVKDKARNGLSKSFAGFKNRMIKRVSGLQPRIIDYLKANKKDFINHTSKAFDTNDLKPHIHSLKIFLDATNTHLRRDDGVLLNALERNFFS